MAQASVCGSGRRGGGGGSMAAWKSAGTRRWTTRRAGGRGGGGGGSEVARVGSGLGLGGAARGRVRASRSHLSRRSRSARRRSEVKRSAEAGRGGSATGGRGRRGGEGVEEPVASQCQSPPRSAPRANRMATPQRQRALAQAGPAVRRAVPPRPVPTVPACAGYHYSLLSRGPEPPTPNGRVALAVSRTAHPRASHRIWARGASGRESGFALVRPA